MDAEGPTGPGCPGNLDQRLDLIARHPFRTKFHLHGRERVIAELSDPATMRLHAHDLIAKRLAPAEPVKDGRQTPYRGHPVFVAQHATATCCRSGHSSIVNARSSAVNWMEVRSQDVTATAAPASAASTTATGAGAPSRRQMSRSNHPATKPKVRSKR